MVRYIVKTPSPADEKEVEQTPCILSSGAMQEYVKRDHSSAKRVLRGKLS